MSARTSRRAAPTLWSAALITHTSTLHLVTKVSLLKTLSSPLLLVPAHSAPLTRSGKKWTNDHSISPANAFHFFVTSISESVIFFAGRRRRYVPNYVTGWMAAPSWPRRPQSCPKRNGDVDEASRLGSTGVPFGFLTELES